MVAISLEDKTSVALLHKRKQKTILRVSHRKAILKQNRRNLVYYHCGKSDHCKSEN